MAGSVAKLLAGQAGDDLEVVVRFLDVAALEPWYDSKDIQALIPLRDRGADVVSKVIEEL